MSEAQTGRPCACQVREPDDFLQTKLVIPILTIECMLYCNSTANRMHRTVKALLSHVGSGIGWGMLILYSFCWIITAAAVVGAIVLLLNTVFSGWLNASGWKQLYLLSGAITVFMCLIRFGPAVVKELLRLIINNPMEAVIAIVVLGCIPIIAIPLIVIGWPFVWWLIWMDFRSRNDRDKADLI